MIIDFTRKKKQKEYEKIGNKASELIALKNEGFKVPGGFVLDSDTFDDIISFNGIERDILDMLEEFSGLGSKAMTTDVIKDTSEKIISLFNNISLPEDIVCKINTFIKDDKKYAVRSSSLKEDMEEHSFAGMYETYLDIEGRMGIKESIIKCYMSLFSVNVLTYIRDNKIDFDSLKMAVIVQEMIPSEVSGVVFSVNPTTGKDTQMVIDAVKGLGSNYVDGTSKPETYKYDWYTREYDYPKENMLLSESMLDDLTSTVLEIQKFCGYPCDIEYGIVGKSIYILQVRAITKINHDMLDRVWTTANYRDGGVSSRVCPMFMYSLYEYVWDIIMGKYLVEAKLRTKKQVPNKLIGMYYGRPYWDLTTVKTGISMVPGYKEREFDSEYSIEMNYDGNGDTTDYNFNSIRHGVSILLAQKKIVKQLNKIINEHIDKCMQGFKEYEKDIDTEFTFEELKGKWMKFIKEHYRESECMYFWHIYINTVEQSIHRNFFLKYVDEMEYLDLLGGMNNISHMRSMEELWKISRVVIEDDVVKSYFEEHSADEIATALGTEKVFSKINEMLKEYLDVYGYHSNRELDLSYPSFKERPADVIAIVKEYMTLEDEDSPMNEKHDRYSVYRTKLRDVKTRMSKPRFKKFLLKLKRIRTMLWNREELKDISTRYYYIIRLYTLKLAKFMIEKGYLESEDDIWYLALDDIVCMLNDELTVEQIQAKIKKNRDYYESYRNYENENEIGQVDGEEKPVKVKDEQGIKGVGCNSGVVTGTARVIHDISEIDRVKKGDILIAKYTDTGWTPKFAKLGGIVTEFGGVLCHAAIVSREYGIPCIVCAHKAMKKIKDGETVTIDGKSGTVVIVNDK